MSLFTCCGVLASNVIPLIVFMYLCTVFNIAGRKDFHLASVSLTAVSLHDGDYVIPSFTKFLLLVGKDQSSSSLTVLYNYNPGH